MSIFAYIIKLRKVNLFYGLPIFVHVIPAVFVHIIYYVCNKCCRSRMYSVVRRKLWAVDILGVL